MIRVLVTVIFLTCASIGVTKDLRWDEAWESEHWEESVEINSKLENSPIKESGLTPTRHPVSPTEKPIPDRHTNDALTPPPDSIDKDASYRIDSQTLYTSQDQIEEFQTAILLGNPGKAKELLETGIDPNAVYYGNTLLQEAVTFTRTLIVKELLSAGADPNLTTVKDTNTPLQKSIKTGNLEITKILIESGSDINCVNSLRENVIHSSICSNYECEADSKDEENILQTILFLVKEGADINAVRNDGMTPLHLAVKEKNFEVAKLLIKNGSSIRGSGSMKKEKAILRLAFESGNKEMINLLLDNGAELSSAFSSIHTIAAKGYTHLLEILIAGGADIDLTDHEKRTPLHLASAYGQIEIMEVLLKSGADLNAIDGTNNTPLHYGGMHKDVFIFLTNNGAEVNLENTEGITPFHYAAPLLDEETLARYLSFGVDINQQDKHGRTALHIAAGINQTMAADFPYLIPVDLDETTDFTAMKTQEDFNPNNAIRFLLKNGSNPTLKDNNGTTPLHLACLNGNISGAKILIEQGAGVNEIDVNGLTPLIFSFFGEGSNNLSELLDTLIKSGADVNVSTVDGFTPLDITLSGSNDSELLKTLQQAGAKSGEQLGYRQVSWKAEDGEGYTTILNSNIETNLSDDRIAWQTDEDEQKNREHYYRLCDNKDFFGYPSSDYTEMAIDFTNDRYSYHKLDYLKDLRIMVSTDDPRIPRYLIEADDRRERVLLELYPSENNDPSTFMTGQYFEPEDLIGKHFIAKIAGVIGGVEAGNYYYRDESGHTSWIDNSHFLNDQLFSATFRTSNAGTSHHIALELTRLIEVFLKLGEPCEVKKNSSEFRANVINMPGVELIAVKESGETRIIENRQAEIEQIDDLRGTLEKAFRVTLPDLDNETLIKIAQQSNTKIFLPDDEVGPREKSEIAKSLNYIFDILDNRVKAAAADQKLACPKVKGIHWDKNDPIGCNIAQIKPFSMYGLWDSYILEEKKEKSNTTTKYISKKDFKEYYDGHTLVQRASPFNRDTNEWLFNVLKSNDEHKIIKGKALERVECIAEKLRQKNVKTVVFPLGRVKAWENTYVRRIEEEGKKIYEDKISPVIRQLLDNLFGVGWYKTLMCLKGNCVDQETGKQLKPDLIKARGYAAQLARKVASYYIMPQYHEDKNMMDGGLNLLPKLHGLKGYSCKEMVLERLRDFDYDLRKGIEKVREYRGKDMITHGGIKALMLDDAHLHINTSNTIMNCYSEDY